MKTACPDLLLSANQRGGEVCSSDSQGTISGFSGISRPIGRVTRSLPVSPSRRFCLDSVFLGAVVQVEEGE